MTHGFQYLVRFSARPTCKLRACDVNLTLDCLYYVKFLTIGNQLKVIPIQWKMAIFALSLETCLRNIKMAPYNMLDTLSSPVLNHVKLLEDSKY